MSRYSYDVLGNLKQVQTLNASITYLVDPLNRRIGRKVNGTLTHGWLYLGARPVAELNPDHTVKTVFFYGEKSNVPSAMLRDGKTYRILSNHLGSVRLVVDVSNGDIAQQLDYDAWGKVISDSNPGFQPFGFAGGLYDSATGLTRFGARDYDAETGRWTAKDPILFAGGDVSLYGYVSGDPVNFVDPSGLATDCEANTAINVLMKRFPEILSKKPRSVRGEKNLQGWLHYFGVDQPLGGVTSVTDDITYNANLYGQNGINIPQGKEDDFLQTLAHEMQHVQANFLERSVTSFGEIEDLIDHNGDLMFKQTYKEFMLERKNQCGCGK